MFGDTQYQKFRTFESLGYAYACVVLLCAFSHVFVVSCYLVVCGVAHTMLQGVR